jgi:hypothetical protein
MGLAAAVLLVSLLILWKGYDLALWYMVASGRAQERVITGILDKAAPIVRTEVTMNFLQKFLASITGRRTEQQRQTDALSDIRTFSEQAFNNHWLRFRVTRNLSSLNGHRLHGYDYSLDWGKAGVDEVLAEFSVDFLKGTMSKTLINQDCGYFSELSLYIRERATAN